ncbi:MAG: hypothetical protein HND40_06760 [Ignavibacteriota bacterium]|jgi:hypothetical protein|nr:hypothetical protein [Ignavibacteriota bacterium]MBV6420890.1 hypothetical protein [Ignavibacteriaceae bacterium]MCO6446838.1 hypothetical protein [Ignavibacterium album]MDT3696743.1 hypothetical protein [Ignavibacterium sp.]QQS37157.1 MAG: hypothetical protein IPM56_04170 [Ignavibacteriales bacterium]
MKRKNLNIFKSIVERVAVRKVFLQIFVIHLLLAHVVLQSYVICFESDGRVVLESMANKQYCCATIISSSNNTNYLEANINEECNLCEDVAITENCDEEYSVTVKKYQPLNSTILIDFNNLNVSSEEKKSTLITQEINYKSTQLDSYKTVLLLI